MISIIICSVNTQLLAAVKLNIAETIGVPFEIIAIDNRNSAAGICEVYNEGTAQAKYQVLCFMHEDVIMQTQNWGTVVCNLLKPQTGVGLIGVAGNYYKTFSPSGWNNASGSTDCLNIVQGFKNKGPEDYVFLHKNPFNQTYTEAAVLDGVWLCTTKAIALEIKFDQQTFTGFHCYDLDFSLNVGQRHKVVVTYEVLLTHLSDGSYTRTWMMETLKLHVKWKDYLPVLRGKLPEGKWKHLEKHTFRDFVYLLIRFNLPLSIAQNLLWTNLYLKKVGFQLWLSMTFHLYKFIKKAKQKPDYHPRAYNVDEGN